ncbi:MAG: RNA methyltransferase [Bacteroidales bacterium]|nr:RNA methyltransferase [Bacteroidales bacterium]
MTELITSAQNPKIKKLLALQQKSSERRSEGLFVVEGRREIEHCVEAGYEIDTVFVCPEVYGSVIPSAVERSRAVFAVSPSVYDKIAYRAGTEGIIAEVKARRLTLEDLKLTESPLIVVLESVEKPGNLGAVLRSADASGADAVIVCDPLTDLYNPNLIRSSIGAIFTVQCVACSSQECIDFLKSKGISILTAQLQDSELYYDSDMKKGVAIVMGTESTGLTDIWRKAADAHIRIPMLGRLDSLNVSVSAAILLYEAVRQRNG